MNRLKGSSKRNDTRDPPKAHAVETSRGGASVHPAENSPFPVDFRQSRPV